MPLIYVATLTPFEDISRDTIGSIATAPNGEHLVALAELDGEAVVYSLSDFSLCARIETVVDGRMFGWVTCGPDASFLAGCYELSAATFWSYDGSPIHRFSTQEAGFEEMRFLPDGRLFERLLPDEPEDGSTPVNGSRIILRDPVTGEALDELAVHDGEICHLDVAWDGHVVATGDNKGVIQVWSSEPGGERWCQQVSERDICSVSLSPCGAWLATTARDGHLQVWDTSQRAVVSSLSAPMDNFANHVISGDGTRLLLNNQGVLRELSLPDLAPLWEYQHAYSFGTMFGRILQSEYVYISDCRHIAIYRWT